MADERAIMVLGLTTGARKVGLSANSVRYSSFVCNDSIGRLATASERTGWSI